MSRGAGFTGSFVFDGDTIGGVTNMSFDYEGDVADATGMDSSGWREFVRGRYRASFEASGHWEGGAGEFPDEADISAVTGSDLVMTFSASTLMPTVTSSGTAWMTGLDPTDNQDGTMDWTMRGVILGTAPTIGLT
jgi:hypothetical protein